MESKAIPVDLVDRIILTNLELMSASPNGLAHHIRNKLSISMGNCEMTQEDINTNGDLIDSILEKVKNKDYLTVLADLEKLQKTRTPMQKQLERINSVNKNLISLMNAYQELGQPVYTTDRVPSQRVSDLIQLIIGDKFIAEDCYLMNIYDRGYNRGGPIFCNKFISNN